MRGKVFAIFAGGLLWLYPFSVLSQRESAGGNNPTETSGTRVRENPEKKIDHNKYVVWPTSGVPAEQDSATMEDLSLLTSMVDIVVEEREKTITTGVLSYLSGVYSDHGYSESGNWGKSVKSPGRSYMNYYTVREILPKYSPEDFIIPAEGCLTSGYGYRPRFGRFHHGIDVAINSGDTVICSLPGIVSKTGYDTGGYGRYALVSHDGGVETLYGHLQICLVSPGQKIKAGEAIGLGGSTGNATGPHLHFETRYRGVAIDPVSWFNLSEKLRGREK